MEFGCEEDVLTSEFVMRREKGIDCFAAGGFVVIPLCRVDTIGPGDINMSLKLERESVEKET